MFKKRPKSHVIEEKNNVKNGFEFKSLNDAAKSMHGFQQELQNYSNESKKKDYILHLRLWHL